VKSYEQLYTDGVQIIQDKGVKQVLHEIAIQKRELIYARDILRAITNDKAQTHLANSHEQYEIIMALKDEITQEWLRLVIKQDDQTQIQRISQGTANAFEIVQQIRKKVGTITKPKKPTDGRIKIMYESIPERGSINLKDLILQIMANEGEDSAQVLDVSLESLAELFRDNCVQINVERRTR